MLPVLTNSWGERCFDASSLPTPYDYQSEAAANSFSNYTDENETVSANEIHMKK